MELKAHATTTTVYEIGSNTKQFTAAAIMMLVEEGKVHLEDAITKYFPEAPEALLKGEYEPASFTPAMGIFLSTATGKAFWKWLRYKVSLGGEWYWFCAKMTKDGKIAQIYWW